MPITPTLGPIRSLLSRLPLHAVACASLLIPFATDALIAQTQVPSSVRGSNGGSDRGSSGSSSHSSDRGLRSPAGEPSGSRMQVVGDREIRVEYRFASPKDATSPSPEGLDRYAIPGISLSGFSTELAAQVGRVIVESVDVVEVDASGVRLRPTADAPLSGDRARDAAALGALPVARPSGIVPAEWAEVHYGGSIGDVPVSTLLVHPYRYDPRRNVILWARSIVLRVESESPLGADVENVARAYTDPRRGGKTDGSLLSITVDPTVAPDGYRYKLFASSDGVYRVRARELKELGLPIGAIDARTLKLYCNGIEVPIYLHDRGDDRLSDDPLNEEYIEFFGRRRRADVDRATSDLYYDPHTRYTAYFLTWGGGLGKRIVDESGDIRVKDARRVADLTSRNASFLSTIHFEEDLIAPGTAELSNVELNDYSDRFDNFMWKPSAAGGIATMPVELPSPNLLRTTPVKIVAALRGASPTGPSRSAALRTRHSLDLYVQNRRALATSFTGQSLLVASTDAGERAVTSADLAPDGKTTINIVNTTSDDGAYKPRFFVNWLDVTYDRLFVARENRLEFSTPPGLGPTYVDFALRGFSSPDVRIYRDGISRIINFPLSRTAPSGRDSAAESGYTAQFQVYAASDADRFTAVTESQLRRPVMTRDRAQNLRAPENDYSYIVIVDDTTARLSTIGDPNHPLVRFARFKEESGERVKIVRVTDIYDEFSNGAVSPWGIRDFLKYAYHSWRRSPKYALIFGSGSPGTEGDNFARERVYVPTIMFQTVDYGPTQCDYLLGCFDGETVVRQNSSEAAARRVIPDFFPEVIVGRVPVRSLTQIGDYVSKLINQEKARDFGEWRNRATFIAGFDEAFSSQVNSFVDTRFRATSEPYRILTGIEFDRSAYGNTSRLLPILNEHGSGLVTYLGHGGGGQWENAFVVSSSTVHTVKNENRMPAILSLTCFTGAYTPEKGLLSAFMVAPRGGALVGLGTPGFGWMLNNTYLAESIFSVLLNPRYRGLTFGQIIALGKARYIGSYQSRFEDNVPTLAAMYAIFGDPSLRIPLTLDTVSLAYEGGTTASAGASVSARVSFPFVPSRVYTALFDTTETTMPGGRTELPGAGSMSISHRVPAGYGGACVGIRVYAYDDAGRTATGTIRFPMAGASIVDVRPVGRLGVGRDAVFEITAARDADIDHVLISLANPGEVVFEKRRFDVTKTGLGRFRTVGVPGADLKPGALVTVTVPAGRMATGDSTSAFYVPGGSELAARRISAIDSTWETYGRPVEAMETFTNETIGMTAGAGGPALSATIYNWGDRPAQGVPVELSYVDDAGSKVILASSTVDVPAGDSVVIHQSVPPQLPVRRTMRLEIRPASGPQRQDVLATNNTSFNTVSLSAGALVRGVGFVGDPAGPGVYTVGGIGRLAASDAPGSALVVATAEPALPPSGQRWTFLRLGDSAFGAAALSLAPDRIDAGRMTATLALPVSRADRSFPRDLTLVRYDRTTRLWSAVQSIRSVDSLEVSATVPVEGVYALAVLDDRDGPEVKFSVEGQFYSDGTAVPRKPRFSIIVSDPSGVATDQNKIVVTIDGRTLKANQEYVVIDSTATSTTINIRVQPELEPGRHQLCVEVSDRVGNVRRACTSFEVESGLSVKVYGNFPNPFQEETFLAYEIRGASVVDDVQLKLYTAAGKLIRTFRSTTSDPLEGVPFTKGGTGHPTTIGYHEIWWDGTDFEGKAVANGVYFYKLSITQHETVVEHTGTIARIR